MLVNVLAEEGCWCRLTDVMGCELTAKFIITPCELWQEVSGVYVVCCLVLLPVLIRNPSSGLSGIRFG